MSDTNKVTPTKEQIRSRAYEVSEARGRRRLDYRRKRAGRAKQPVRTENTSGQARLDKCTPGRKGFLQCLP